MNSYNSLCALKESTNFFHGKRWRTGGKKRRRERLGRRGMNWLEICLPNPNLAIGELESLFPLLVTSPMTFAT